MPTRLRSTLPSTPEIIYDFYGFPEHYYKVPYPNRGSLTVAEKVIVRLQSAGIESRKVQRGLDHGVWVGFLAGKSCNPPYRRCRYADANAGFSL